MLSAATAGISSAGTSRGVIASSDGFCRPLKADISAGGEVEHRDRRLRPRGVRHQRQAAGHQADLGGDHQAPAIHPVRQRAADERRQQQRHQLHDPEHADREAGVRQRVHLPRQRHVGDHRAEEGHRLGGVEQAEVPPAEGTEIHGNGLSRTGLCTDKRPAQPTCKTVRRLATLSGPGHEPDPAAAADPSTTAPDFAGEPTSAPGSPWLGGYLAGDVELAVVRPRAGRDRPLPDPGAARRRRHGRRLPRPADRAAAPRRRAEDRQARHRHRSRRRPLRARAARRWRASITRTSRGSSTPAPPTDGRPYFVMELVLGERGDRPTATPHRLDVDARLAIFLDICQAVRHAHQRGVLHRDLKPSNVLVTPVDGRPVPKVIDFGIAKVMDDTDDHPALDTRLSGQAIGTPAYMSPEQAGRIDTGVDTRTDVYSLGVLLYELLTGHHPRDYAPHDAHSTSGDRRPSEAVVRTLTPPRGAVAADALADRRQSTPQRLRRRLAGNLDTVVLKAIELEPDRRYDSVEQFADDVRRVIAGEPVRAKPPTWIYRSRRFVRRHRVVVGAASAAVVLLAATRGRAGMAAGRRRARARPGPRSRGSRGARRPRGQSGDRLPGRALRAGRAGAVRRTDHHRARGARRGRGAGPPRARRRAGRPRPPAPHDGGGLHADGAARPGGAAPARRAGNPACRRRSAGRRPLRDPAAIEPPPRAA